ncbi:MAG: response regulator [Desulfamplus sp.]|nr:response regulator [Desulfamplus sp.]
MEDNKRILVIDDDEGIRETYQDIFTPEKESDVLQKGATLFGNNPGIQKPKQRKKANYHLSSAENGTRGVELVKKSVSLNNPFAVAFVDMKMPGIDGAQTSKQVWAIDPRIKIVIVTAYSEYTPDDIIATTGRDDIFYLRKPFNHEEILQFARALANEWNLEQKRDILEVQLKAVNETLEDMNKNLKDKVEKQASMIVQAEKMASVGMLAAGVAHEINNPLSFINSNLSALKRYLKKIDALHRKYDEVELFLRYSGLENAPALINELAVFKIENKTDLIMADIADLTDESLEGIENIKKIVNDLKTFSRIDEADYSSLDINKAIDTTINILWNEIKYKAEIVKNYGRVPEIKCFPQKIGQALMNLILNASQAMDQQGKITISTDVVAKDIRIENREPGATNNQKTANQRTANPETSNAETVNPDRAGITPISQNSREKDEKKSAISQKSLEKGEKKGAVENESKMEKESTINQHDKFIRIKIADTGCGIAKENLNRLFDPFFTTKPVGKGTGLGLSITYEIIKSHNGTIEVSSEPGSGTEMTVYLPIGGEN